ncbi:TIM barrel protein [Bacillus toyonensis]|uniref:sugar phosphate isomerase/epimerase family protein n=1 Tax=Bacillus toyonensis TaxID=155322 RepID=UPI003D1A279D
MRAKLTINLDEISSNLDVSFAFLKEMDLHTCELRIINGKNISLMNKEEIIQFSKKLELEGIIPVSIASPIFKWNVRKSEENVVYDNFGISPNLSFKEKEQLIDNILEYAEILAIEKIRIFSYLGKMDNPFSYFLNNRLLEKIKKSNLTFLLENEPACTIYTKKHLEYLTDLITDNHMSNIKIWLDIANLIQVGEEINESFIEKIAPYIEYVHIKDFIYSGNSIKYVPVGDGIINYMKIMSLLNKHIPNSQDITISIETHASNEKEKYEYSKKSIISLREILKGVKYENYR